MLFQTSGQTKLELVSEAQSLRRIQVDIETTIVPQLVRSSTYNINTCFFNTLLLTPNIFTGNGELFPHCAEKDCGQCQRECSKLTSYSCYSATFSSKCWHLLQATVGEVLQSVGVAQEFFNKNATQIVKTVSTSAGHMRGT